MERRFAAAVLLTLGLVTLAGPPAPAGGPPPGSGDCEPVSGGETGTCGSAEITAPDGTTVEVTDLGTDAPGIDGEILAALGITLTGDGPVIVTFTFTEDGRVCVVFLGDDGSELSRCSTQPGFAQDTRTLSLPVIGPGTVALVSVPEGSVRLAGTDRVGTALQTSRSGWDSAPDVLLASAGAFPDALAASVLAGMLDAPLLLTPGDVLHEDVAAELERLGAERVHVLGGTAAVSQDVADAVAAMGIEVLRLGGASRTETAELVAAAAGGAHHGIAFVASGDQFADALAAAPIAAGGVPIYLTAGGQLTDATLAAMDAGHVNSVTILGGTAAVPAAVETQLDAAGMHLGPRQAGATRYETAVAVMDYAVLSGFDLTELLIATGADFPDALAAGAYGGRTDRPVLLVDPAAEGGGTPAQAYLTEHAAQTELLVLLGGEAAIPETVEQSLTASVVG